MADNKQLLVMSKAVHDLPGGDLGPRGATVSSGLNLDIPVFAPGSRQRILAGLSFAPEAVNVSLTDQECAPVLQFSKMGFKMCSSFDGIGKNSLWLGRVES